MLRPRPFAAGAAAGAKDIVERKVTVPAVKDLRLDLVPQAVITQIGGQPEIRKDTVRVVPFGAGKKHTTLQQPPDATHAVAVAALDQKLATKTDIGANNEVPLAEFLAAVSKPHELPFVVRQEAFREEGVANILDVKPTIKAAKGAALETVLRETLRSVDADFVVDGDGNVSVVPKSVGPKK